MMNVRMNIKHWLAQTTWVVVLTLNSFGQGTAFVYQGHLHDGVSPANGNYDLRFAIYDGSTNGNQVGSGRTNAASFVSNGLFAVTLDFGGIFSGADYWLDIGVRTNGNDAFTALLPRQPITPVPYAIMAHSATNLLGTLPASQISGTLASAQLPASLVTNGAGGVNLTGTFSGTGSGLTGVFATNLTSDVSILSIVRSSSAPIPATNWTFHAMDSASSNFLTLGGLVDSGANGPGGYFGPLKIQTGAGGAAGAFTTAKAMSQSFAIDGSQFVFGMLGQGRIFNIVVNGVDNYVTNSVPSDGNPYWFTVTFATASTRKIILKNVYAFKGVYTFVTDGFISTKVLQTHRMVVLGDSYTEQDYAPGALCAGIVSQMQNLLLDYDIWALGEGGTGFVNPGISGGTNFVGRIGDVTRASPNYIVIYGGINDAGNATNTSLTNIVYVNATNLINSLQAQLPFSKIAVIGPQWPRTPSPVGDPTVFNCALLLSNACFVCGVKYVNPIAEPWITGHTLSPGSGNAVNYILASDGTHPTIPAGARFLANKIVAAISEFWDLKTPVINQSSGAIALTANDMPTPAPRLGFLWNSNNALYWVTTFHTNYITGP